MKKIIFLAISCSIAIAATANDTFTVDAIKNGQASGLVNAEQSKKIMTATHATTPISMTVKVLHRYTQAGCARLDYIVQQPNVKAKDGTIQELRMQWQMNICEDGQPPLKPMTIKK